MEWPLVIVGVIGVALVIDRVLDRWRGQPQAPIVGLTPANLATINGEVRAGIDGLRSDMVPSLENVSKTVGQLSEQARTMEGIGRDISSLQDILRPPKMRGALGELLLERALAHALPPNAFDTQHRFPNGTIVDAIVTVGERIVPIDSKFPLEAFQRMVDGGATPDLRKKFDYSLHDHIDAVSKYILPAEGTFSFALMYIPSEAVYYEASLSDGLREYAYAKRVVFVSPSTLYAYLEVIALGLKGLAVEGSARSIMDNLAALKDMVEAVDEEIDVTGKHLGNAVMRNSRASQKVQQLAYELDRALTLD